MSYHESTLISPLPHVQCDECGLLKPAVSKKGIELPWIVNRKGAGGWMAVVKGKYQRRDFCQVCRMNHEFSKVVARD